MSAVDDLVDERRREREALGPRLEVNVAERATDGVPRESLQAEQPVRVAGVIEQRSDILHVVSVST